MRSYKSLQTVSNFFKWVGYLNFLAALIIAAIGLMSNSDADPMKLIIALGVILIGIISMVCFLALSQFISLMINISEDISTIATNVYALASKKELENS